jgi:hypothetical protein
LTQSDDAGTQTSVVGACGLDACKKYVTNGTRMNADLADVRGWKVRRFVLIRAYPLNPRASEFYSFFFVFILFGALSH